jgi:predicted P-loop ATPase
MYMTYNSIKGGDDQPSNDGDEARGADATYRGDLQPEFEKAKRFLTTLDPTADEFTFQTFDDNKARRKENLKRLRYDPLERVIHGTLEECWAELVQLNRKGAGIFVCLNRIEPPLDEHGKVKTRGKGVRLKSNISAIRCNFTDDDDGFAGEYPLPPSVVTSTSPGKKQALWQYSEPVAAGPARADAQGRVTLSEEALQVRAKFDAIQERMVAEFGCDKGAKDLPRVFRLPGLFHRKREPYLVHVIGENEEHFSQDEVMVAFKAEVRKVKPRPVRKTIDNYYLNDYDKWREILTMKRALTFIHVDDNRDWSDTRKMLQRWRVKHGIPDPIAFSLFDEVSAASEGYCGTDDCWREWDRGTEEGDWPEDKLLGPGTLFDRAKPNGYKGYPVTPEDYAEIAQHCYIAGLTDGSGEPYSRRQARNFSSALAACADVATASDRDAVRRRWGKALYDLGWGARGYRLWLKWRRLGKNQVNSKDEPLFILSKCRAEWLAFKDYVLPEGETAPTVADIVKAANERNWTSPLVPKWPDRNREKRPHTNALRNFEELLRAENMAIRHENFTGQDELKFEEGDKFERVTDNHLLAILAVAHRAKPEPLLIGINNVDQFTSIVAKERAYDKLLNYLNSLRWDDKQRCELLFPYYFSVEDNTYTRAVSKLAMVALVRRAKQPGVKYDYVPVVESPQGGKKSPGVGALCPFPDLFSENVPLGADSKTLIERTEGKWIVEFAELDGMQKSDVASTRAALSRRTDEARLACGRRTTQRDRQWGGIGTINPSVDGLGYLRDQTGNRRFLPMAMKDGALVKVEDIERDRDQLWAEAVILEREYGPLLELPAEIIPLAAAEQENRREKTPQEIEFDERVAEVSAGFISEDEIWASMGLGANMANPTAKVRRNKQHVAIRNRVMKKHGFVKSRPRWSRDYKRSFLKGEVEVEYWFDATKDSFVQLGTNTRPRPANDGTDIVKETTGINIVELPRRPR